MTTDHCSPVSAAAARKRCIHWGAIVNGKPARAS